MKFCIGELYEKVSGQFSFCLHQMILITALHEDQLFVDRGCRVVSATDPYGR
jgi:hypothetical protein